MFTRRPKFVALIADLLVGLIAGLIAVPVALIPLNVEPMMLRRAVQQQTMRTPIFSAFRASVPIDP